MLSESLLICLWVKDLYTCVYTLVYTCVICLALSLLVLINILLQELYILLS